MTGNLDKIFAAMEASGAAYREARLARFEKLDTSATFCPEDLGDWIDLCDRASVPYVPAKCIAEVGVDDVVSYDTVGPHTERAKPFWEAVEVARALPNHMMRWSCCSCAEVKYRLGNGEHQWAKEIQDRFHVADMRAFDLICGFPKPTIRAWLRPWLNFHIIDGFPLEFRAFVERNKIVGVSSYYPQRPLPVSWQMAECVSKVILLTQRLLDRQLKPLNMPDFEGAGLPMTENHWTADFAFQEGAGPLFLEGGPPHHPMWGAHPCCFAVGEIEGIALRPRVGMAGDVAEVIATDVDAETGCADDQLFGDVPLDVLRDAADDLARRRE